MLNFELLSDQLKEIRNVNIAKIFCDNGDYIDRLPKTMMRVLNYKTNPLQDCDSLPGIDLTKWSVGED